MSLVWLAAWARAQDAPDDERRMQDALLGPPGCWVVPFRASEVRDTTTQEHAGDLRFSEHQWTFLDKPHPVEAPGGVGVGPYTTLFARWQFPTPARGSTAVVHALTFSRSHAPGRTVLAAEAGSNRGSPVRLDFSVMVHLESAAQRPVAIDLRDVNTEASVTRTVLLHESGLPSSETIEADRVEGGALRRRHHLSTTTYTFDAPRPCEELALP